jgi:hypothetical protein
MFTPTHIPRGVLISPDQDSTAHYGDTLGLISQPIDKADVDGPRESNQYPVIHDQQRLRRAVIRYPCNA